MLVGRPEGGGRNSAQHSASSVGCTGMARGSTAPPRGVVSSGEILRCFMWCDSENCCRSRVAWVVPSGSNVSFAAKVPDRGAFLRVGCEGCMKHARSTLEPASAQFWFSYALSWLGRQCMAYIHGTWRGQLAGARWRCRVESSRISGDRSETRNYAHRATVHLMDKNRVTRRTPRDVRMPLERDCERRSQ